jgi:hypothetical protein
MVTPLVDRYRYAECIRSGDRAIAWLVDDDTTGRRLCAAPIGSSRIAGYEAIKGLAHPHLAAIVDVIRSPEQGTIPDDFGALRVAAVVLAEHVPGQSLHDRMKSQALSQREAIMHVVGVVRAVVEMHQREMPHGAISPRTIIVVPEVARASPVLTQLTAATSGTYCSRERLQRRGPSLEDDSWALHATLYSALSGAAPFAGLTRDDLIRSMLAGEPRKIGELGVDSPALEALLARGLVHNPRWRPAVSELLVGLEHWLNAQADADDDDAQTVMRESPLRETPALSIPPVPFFEPESVRPPPVAATAVQSPKADEQIEVPDDAWESDEPPEAAASPAKLAADASSSIPSAAPAQSVSPEEPPASPRLGAAAVQTGVEPSTEPQEPDESPDEQPASGPDPAQPATAQEPVSPAQPAIAQEPVTPAQPATAQEPITPAQPAIAQEPATASDGDPLIGMFEQDERGRRRGRVGVLVGLIALVIMTGWVLRRATSHSSSTRGAPASSVADAPPKPAASAAAADSAAAAAPVGSAAPVTSAGQSAEAGTGVEPGGRRACVSDLLGADTISPDADLDFLCADRDLRSISATLTVRLIVGARGRPNPSLRDWRDAGWYQLGMSAVLRHRCCPSPPVALPKPRGACDALDQPLQALAAAAGDRTGTGTEGASAPLDAFEAAVGCFFAKGVPRPYPYAKPIKSHNRSAFERFRTRIRAGVTPGG